MIQFKEILKIGAIGMIAGLALTGCGGSDSDSVRTDNVLTGKYNLTYLRVNDNSVICYNGGKTMSNDYGWACDFADVDIPNGVEAIELNDKNFKFDDWELLRLVDVKNKTSDCITYYDDIVACDFKSESVKGSLGEESETPSSSKPETAKPSSDVTSSPSADSSQVTEGSSSNK